MGVRSTGSQHPTTTQADGHLLEYFRNDLGAGGAGTNALGPKNQATGGTKTFGPGPTGPQHYTIHKFTSSGSLIV